MTGLRFSDINNLTWNEIENVEGQGYFIKFQQQKTKGIETLPIAEQAYGFLGDSQQGEIKVFNGLKSTSYHQKSLKEWLTVANITKHITFHMARHGQKHIYLKYSLLVENTTQQVTI